MSSAPTSLQPGSVSTHVLHAARDRPRCLPALAVAVGLATGALTAYAQGWLGDGLGSLANSAGPWALAATAVALGARRPSTAAALATVVLMCCECGYAAATVARGGTNAASTVQFWLLAAALAGPPLGVAAAWSRERTGGVRAAIGAGVLPGVLIGEGVWGLTAIGATTNRWYWAAEVILGTTAVGVAAWLATRRPIGRWRLAAATVLAAGASATVVLVAAHLA